ncbi:ABC transporter permease subunit [Glaciecola sp. SC05]|uniref:ABC transporter permease subunit n=1 Tax=Glaciecola sp. SC05 TaxID=1987355 RepID=UPI0035270C48
MHLKRLANIASFELVRLFLTKRGLLAVITFSICWLLILRYPIAGSVSLLNSPDFAGFFDSVFGAIGLSKLLSWLAAELAVYWLIALYSFPIFCLFLCGDQIVGDKQRGTLRFLSLRATRAELLIGRFIGQVLILAILLMLTLSATLAILTYRDPALLATALPHSLLLFGYLIVSVMPFIALMSLINTFANSARLAFVFAILFFAGGNIIVGILSWQIPALGMLSFIFPGYQLDQMAGQNAEAILAIGLPLAQTAVLLLLAQRIFARSAL